MRKRVDICCLSAALLLACDEKAGGGVSPGARGEAVVASGTATANAVPSASSPPAAHSAPVVPTKALCEGAWTERAFAKPQVVEVSADGAQGKGGAWRPPAGKWIWLNLFASWCGPCKEEIPRLRRWEKEGKFTLAFLSLDDDERELVKFLKSPLGADVGRPIWLKDDGARERWLREMQIKSPPNLPVQVLIDPSGKVRCINGGAVEETDVAVVRDKFR